MNLPMRRTAEVFNVWDQPTLSGPAASSGQAATTGQAASSSQAASSGEGVWRESRSRGRSPTPRRTGVTGSSRPAVPQDGHAMDTMSAARIPSVPPKPSRPVAEVPIGKAKARPPPEFEVRQWKNPPPPAKQDGNTDQRRQAQGSGQTGIPKKAAPPVLDESKAACKMPEHLRRPLANDRHILR